LDFTGSVPKVSVVCLLVCLRRVPKRIDNDRDDGLKALAPIVVFGFDLIDRRRRRGYLMLVAVLVDLRRLRDLDGAFENRLDIR